MKNSSSNDSESVKSKIPVAEGLFHQPISPDDKPYLIGTKCTRCGYISFPRIPVCPHCAVQNTMEEIHLGGRGKIDSFTIVWSTLPGFEAPSVQSLITLEEGVTIWSLMAGCEASEEALKIGMEVELVIGKVKEDRDHQIVSYQFKPVTNV